MTDEQLNDEQMDEIEGQVDEAEAGEDEEKSLGNKLKEVIDVKVDEIAPLRRKLTISVPRDTLDGQVNEQYEELRKEAMVPGFRKGRAPRRLLEKRFGSEVSETLVQQLVSAGYTAATEKTDLKTLGDPLIYVKGDGDGEELMEAQDAIAKMKLPPEGPLVFSCEVEIRPEFELPNLDGIELEKPILTVSEEEVAKQVDYFRAMRGTYEVVSEGGIQANDLITADLKMTSDGSLVKEQADVKLAARPQVVEGVILEKLGDTLTGAKIDDTVSVTGTIPDDYAKSEFRGKTATFEFKIKDVQRMKLPEMNEEFLKTLGFDSAEELTKWVRDRMESQVDDEIKELMHGQVSRYLLDNTSFDLPERLSNRQINQVTASRIIEMYRRGVPPAEAEKMIDDLKTSSREDAIRDLKLAFVMEKLAEKIDVEVTEGEINTMIAAIAQRQGQRFDRVRDELAKQGSLSTLYVRLRDGKILDVLIGNAKVTEAKLEDIKARKKPAKKTSEASASDADEKPAPAKSGSDDDAGEAKPREQVKRTPPKKSKKDKGENLADET